MCIRMCKRCLDNCVHRVYNRTAYSMLCSMLRSMLYVLDALVIASIDLHCRDHACQCPTLSTPS